MRALEAATASALRPCALRVSASRSRASIVAGIERERLVEGRGGLIDIAWRCRTLTAEAAVEVGKLRRLENARRRDRVDRRAWRGIVVAATAACKLELGDEIAVLLGLGDRLRGRELGRDLRRIIRSSPPSAARHRLHRLVRGLDVGRLRLAAGLAAAAAACGWRRRRTGRSGERSATDERDRAVVKASSICISCAEREWRRNCRRRLVPDRRAGQAIAGPRLNPQLNCRSKSSRARVRARGGALARDALDRSSGGAAVCRNPPVHPI